MNASRSPAQLKKKKEKKEKKKMKKTMISHQRNTF
jgi:hypothetical protein